MGCPDSRATNPTNHPMAESVRAVPEGYHTITPYLIVDGAPEAIEYYKTVFGATEVTRMEMPDGKVGHAELKIGDSLIMLADEHPEMDAKGPRAFGGSPQFLHLYLEEVDAVVAKAVEAGGKVVREVKDQFYGDRSGGFEDPFGHTWHIATHIEDVSPEEMEARMAAQAGQEC